MKENFNECIRDYLEAVAGFPNIGYQLILWLCSTKKPAFMPMHEFMQRQVQLLSYLEGGCVCQTMELPTAQEKSNHIFYAQPKAHQFKFAETNKLVSMALLWLIAFFKQNARQPIKQPASLTRSRRKSSQKRRRRLIFPSLAAAISYRQHHCKNCNYHQSN